MRRSALRLVLIGLLVLEGALVMAVGVAFGQAPSPAPGYLADDYHQLALGSNRFMSHAKLVGRSYRLQLSPKSTPESYGPIWTSTCPSAAETIKFSRSAWLPGPPNYGGEFTYGSLLGQKELGKLGTIDLIVNGEEIVHQALPRGTGFFRVPVSGAALNAFRYGNNTITVRVHKLKTHGACNTRNAATKLGLWFRLEGQFETDLAVNQAQPARYRLLAPGQSYTAIIGVQIHNYGPSWEPTGTFELSGQGMQSLILSSIPSGPGPPFTNCQVIDNGLSHIVTCGLSDFAPGTAPLLYIVFQVQAPSSSYSQYSVGFNWDVGAGAVTDLNSTNNQSTIQYVFCGPQATDPGCQTAS